MNEEIEEDPQTLMDQEWKRLLSLSPTDSPSIRFYKWKGPCATFGYFLNPWDHLNPKGVEQTGLQLGQRPTGGGLIFHLTDLAFSVLIPASHSGYSCNTLENYAYVNQKVIWALQEFHQDLKPQFFIQNQTKDRPDFCMARPTIYDLMIEGVKVGGAAQRRTKQGFLHQGSLCLTLPDEKFLRQVLKDPDRMIPQFYQNSFPLFERYRNDEMAREKLKKCIALQFRF